MTAGANSLTARASSTNISGPPGPALQFRAFVDAFERLGYDVHALLNVIGVRRQDLDDPDGVVPCEKTAELFCGALRQRPLANLGLRLAAETPIGASGLLDYLILTAPTVGDGLTQAERYFRTLSGAPFSIQTVDGQETVRVVLHAAGVDVRFGVEYTAARMVLHLRSETDGRAVFDSVSFTHRPDDVLALERALGCPVHAEASWNGLSMPRSTWELPLRRGDLRLQRLLEAQAPSPADSGTVAFDVRRVVTARLREGVPDIGDVAGYLGVSTRTLQRRLAGAGQSFNGVVEATRREAAETWLAQSALAIGEIGYLLGYSDAAAFHRAFKRWTGLTPQAFRRGAPPRVRSAH
jgi:AraC-like DNA-binding protein